MNSGLVYLFTGDGKGKTSAAVATALRGLAAGWRVTWVAFYKNAEWNIGEFQLPSMLQPPWSERFTLIAEGKGFYIQKPESVLERAGKKTKVVRTGPGVVVDTAESSDHELAAEAGLTAALSVLRSDTRPDLLILDEVANAVADGLLSEKALLDLLINRQATHIVLTGRSASDTLIEAADLVSRIEKVKHPFDSGRLAVQGLDF